MKESISDSQIDNAWEKILPELNRVLPEKKHKRFLLFPYLFAICVLMILGIIGVNYFPDKKTLNNSGQVTMQKPINNNQNEFSNATNKLNESQNSIIEFNNKNSVKNNFVEEISSEKVKSGSINNLKDVNSQFEFNQDENNPIKMDVIEDELIFLKQKLRNLNVKHASDSILIIDIPEVKMKKIKRPEFHQKIYLGLGALTSVNSYTFNHQDKQRIFNQMGFRAFLKYKWSKLWQFNYSFNYLPLSVNYQFENHINSSLYYNKTSIFKFNTLNHDIGLSVQLTKHWSLNSGFYFASNLKKVNALHQNMYKFENSEKIMSEEYKKINHDFGIFKRDIGFIAGAEYRFNRFSIGVQKNIGLINVIKQDLYFKRNTNNVISLNLYLR